MSFTDGANAIRALTIDAVEAANSGHPGAPMGLAEICEVLWREYLSHNPKNPHWINRDRFVLSNGHASMLLYSLLHLTGYDLSIADIKKFRQFGSKTPGHPEFGHTHGCETTTGPLGQGLGNAVGMAVAEKMLAAQFNKPDCNIIDHYTYAIVGDGCLMEGVSHEVYNWQVIDNIDGYNQDAIREAFNTAKQDRQRPTLICCQTVIGRLSPNKQGKASSHGAALGADEVKKTKEAMGWQHPEFEIPEQLNNHWNHEVAGSQAEQQWNTKWDFYQSNYSTEASELQRRLNGQLPTSFDSQVEQFIASMQNQMQDTATRVASKDCLQFLSSLLPELIGGSADLSGSVGTLTKHTKPINTGDFQGNYIYYGVREFGMATVMNGIALYRGFINFGATFLVFRDYAANAMRLSALMQLRAIYILTHDSIGLGEDGPTHQPIEQLGAMRMLPNLHTWRPCDAVETAVAWKSAIAHQKTPTALVLSRQKLSCQQRNAAVVKQIAKGGYVLIDCGTEPDIILIATGSEVELAVAAQKALQDKDINANVVSMPCCELFLKQDIAYQHSVLPPTVTKRLAIEAGSTNFWYQFVGLEGAVLGIDHFGASAPAAVLFEKFGFSTKNIVNKALQLVSRN